MSGIDYSKWDKLSCSSSSSASDVYSDNEECRGSSRSPRVTRLKYPSCVTMGPDGVQLVQGSPEASANPFRKAAEPCAVWHTSTDAPACLSNKRSSVDSVGTREDTSSDRIPAPTGVRKDDQACVDTSDDDEDLLYESLVRNGGREGSHHWWSQTEDTVSVSFLVPWETNSKAVTVFRLYEAPPLSMQASEQLTTHLEITIHPSPPHAALTRDTQCFSSSPLEIREVFRYPVKLSEDLIDGCWQLYRMPKRHLRLLVVQLFKEPLGLGMVLWWDRCFATDTISVISDTHTLPDRIRRMGSTPQSREKAEQFRKVWADAHEEFRRRMHERRQKEID